MIKLLLLWMVYKAFEPRETADYQQAVDTESEEQNSIISDIYYYLNSVRYNQNLPNLRLDYYLSQLAQRHCENMYVSQSMHHSSFPYSENVAYGHGNGYDVIQGWIDSPGHYANIINPDFKLVGIGAYGLYYCTIFER